MGIVWLMMESMQEFERNLKHLEFEMAGVKGRLDNLE